MKLIERLGDVHIRRHGHVACVEISKPPVNVMTVDLARDLADVLEMLDQELEIRAVVLSTTGKVFCAGADLGDAQNSAGLVGDSVPLLYIQAERLYATSLPIVAAIQGAAVGAGLGLALIADIRVAAPDARFSANFTRLGFHPGFGLTYTLPRLIGEHRASMMFLTSRRVQADEALAWGLADRIVAAEALMDAAVTLADEIAENAPLALRATRKTLRFKASVAVADAARREFAEQQWLMKTNDFREGVKSVTDRRPANFVGN